jgi:hypothetical protein
MSIVSRAGKRPALDDYSARDSQNAQAAAVILAHVEQYGGEEAGLVRWARLVSGRIGLQATAPPEQPQIDGVPA